MKSTDCDVTFSPMHYRFDRFQLDIDGGTLSGPLGHVSLPDKPFKLLCALVSAEGKVLGKEAAMDTVWPGQIVSDASLATALKALRQAIGDTGEAQRLIETVKGRGIRLAVPVIPVGAAMPQASVHAVDEMTQQAPPTLAVLEFSVPAGNLGRAIPADLISALSVSRELRVIARGSSFRFLSGTARPRDLQVHCGADYVLSGEIKGGNRERRISVELADTRTEVVVWSSHLDLSGAEDNELGPTLQRQLVPILSLRISGYESTLATGKPAGSLSVWEAYHLGVTEGQRLTAKGNLKAIEHLQRAVELDPEFSSAYAVLSDVAFGMAFSHFHPDRPAYLERARAWADRAVEIDPDNPLACMAKGRSYWILKAPGEGIHWLDRALELDPNMSLATYSRGALYNLTGQADEAFQDLAAAIQSSPLDPRIFSMRGHLGVASMQREDFDKAMEWTEHAARSPRVEHLTLFVACVAASLAGDKARAEHWKSELARAAPRITPALFFESMPLPPATQKQFAQAFERIG
ncbi:winged helix-turn-helix domain-containing tetratricopeptide repeat protein [Roseibium sp.]|uniref:winged helix-turn-helix domain-containing tetratricopeptide repeat protein n=1 Tax=Roseibium sp. TaxID=1936156 RepID=UPI003A970C97